ncbi:MAG: transposase domain-containing protein [Methylococcaceae bacterium]|nr:transposase domain-containing protein [Methylococcaceae bacterium]
MVVPPFVERWPDRRHRFQPHPGLQGLDLNPETYLKDVLTRLPVTKQKDIDSLLPHNWKPAGA